MIQIEAGAVDPDAPMVLWDNVLARGTLTTDSQTVPDGLAAYAVNGLTWDFWVPSTYPARLTVTLPAPETVDCIAIAAHTLGSTGAGLTLVRSNDGGATWFDIVRLDPPDDAPAMAIIAPRTGNAWRLRIDTPTPSAPVLGVVMVGRRTVFPAELLAPYVPLADGQRIEADSAMSVEGQFLDPFVSVMGAETTVQLSPVERAWADANLPPFRNHYDRARPFFWAGAPTMLPEDVAYVRRNPRARELRPALVHGGLYREIQMELEAYAG